VRRFYPLAVFVVAVGIGTWTLMAGGREPVAFLMLATVTLGWVVWLVFRAAESLVKPLENTDGIVATGRRRKELEREKQSLLKAIKELEFDHEMGKVSERDFADIGQQYRGRAIRVLRQLDEGGQEYEALIAKDVAARLKKDGVAPKPVEKPSNAEKIAAVEKAAAEGRISCKGCGTSNDGDAEFCKKCGARLSATETAS
jgi:hypothetical protein